ncbi:hypothetical protein AQI88_20420 [Streptomyces cellostaticus]|uniref:Gram-positive cocci surface proteins LPxTG domain-containing protein n=1 Tax=Streptomyces cellostaticus TaxID=67285 RepID=A0A101NKH2_9ACTN|nr:hypothetical protein [Streptomyces cellostaticus]KUM94561.1 hypothetical protein AQI88_20420 [Streptomyces cellostaticus]
MFMRLCTSLSLCLAAAAALVPVSSDVAHADAAAPACAASAASGGRAFPLATRIRGGPASYEAGGGYGTWYIDLTNTTHRICTGIHPVIVLVDDKRVLKPSQTDLDFYEGPRAHPVTFESTDEQELVGVLDAPGFDGFTVAPGKTVSVRVRLSVALDSAPDQVTANAAVVQRRGDDGDWVGQSDDYHFGIGQDEETAAATEGTAAPETAEASPAGTPEATPTSADPDDDTALAFAQEAEEAGERARELARTGLGLAHGLLAAGSALLAVGAGAYLLARRRR